MASTIPDVQMIIVSLADPDVVIEPGSAAQLVVTMTNRQDAPDRLLLDVEGIDVEWYSIPVAAVNVAPGATVTERILFKVARNSENRAGSYPFLVRVQAMETGEVGIAQATLVVKPYNALQVELNPKRGVATFFHPHNDFDVMVGNLGNSEETLDLYANDPEDGCAYEFDIDRISLKPGQSQVVPLAARPKVSSLLGGARLYGFTVSARSVADSYVSANTHGQLEKRALISPLLGIFLLLLGFGGGAYWINRPRPLQPLVVSKFAADNRRVPSGQEATLTWQVAPETAQVTIWQRVGDGGVDVASPGAQSKTVGVVQVKPQGPRTIYTLVVHGQASQKDLRREVSIDVTPPPPAPKPLIRGFTGDTGVIHQGESVTLRWEARGKNFIIDPGNVVLGPYTATYSFTPDKDTVYTLRAIGEDPNATPASKTFAVRVASKDACIAEIETFRAKNPDVYIGDKVILRWSTRYARSVRLDSDRGVAPGELRSQSGSIGVSVVEPTVFTLTATDSIGKVVTKAVTVTPRARPAPPDPLTTPPPADAKPPTTDNNAIQPVPNDTGGTANSGQR